MTIKKQYQEIVALLEANSNKKVSTLLPQIMELTARKSNGNSEGTVYRDDDGNVIAIYCYYHKKWEILDYFTYGAKKSTSHGFNTMCKEGVSAWTKQQNIAKRDKEALLNLVAEGAISVEELPSKQEEIELARKAIVPTTNELPCFDTIEELELHLNS